MDCLSGDVGQRIFQHPFSWASLGVDVRGRSHTLKVCYRTSQQIRRAADKLLPTVLRDTDGLEDERRGIISVFDGPAPEVKSLADVAAEADAVRQTVETWLGEGLVSHEIGLFVRTPQLVTRARAAIAGRSNEPRRGAGISCGRRDGLATSASPTPPTRLNSTTSTKPSAACSMSPAPGRANICFSRA
jgi:hypothetical protein